MRRPFAELIRLRTAAAVVIGLCASCADGAPGGGADVGAAVGDAFAEGPLTGEEWSALCVRLSACTGDDPSACRRLAVFDVSPPVPNGPSGARCVLAAADCEEAMRCMGYRVEEDCHPDGDRCADERQIEWCSPLGNGQVVPQRLECAAAVPPNPRCELAGGVPLCVTGPCETANGTTRCVGDVFETCVSGFVVRLDCAATGKRCDQFAPGAVESEDAVYCLGPAAPEPGPPCEHAQCVDGLLVGCGDTSGRALPPFDCRAIEDGLSCVTDGGGSAWCAASAADAECDRADSWCEGDSVRFCVQGATLSLDCSAFRGGTCAPALEDGVRCKTPDWP